MRTPLVILLLLLTSNPSLAGIFKCTDQDGNITYSQQPCDDGSGRVEQHDLIRNTGVDQPASATYKSQGGPLSPDQHRLFRITILAQLMMHRCDRRKFTGGFEFASLMADFRAHHRKSLDDMYVTLNTGDTMSYQLKVHDHAVQYSNRMSGASDEEVAAACNSLVNEVRDSMR